MKPARQIVDGVLLLNKPVGLTSNTALQKAKRLLKAQKAGHTGTLDPFADGLLPLCYGEATKFSHYLLDADKTYRAVMQLGVTTTTGDPEGEILQTRPVIVDAIAVHAAMQTYARAGIEIDRPPRRITIHALELIACALPQVSFNVRCSSGTYIRTLAQDIGAALGCGAYLTALTRTAVAGFKLNQAHTLAELEALDTDQRRALLMPADCLVVHLPVVTLDDVDAEALCQGRSITYLAEPSGLMRVYTRSQRFLGLADANNALLVPRRLIATQQPLPIGIETAP